MYSLGLLRRRAAASPLSRSRRAAFSKVGPPAFGAIWVRIVTDAFRPTVTEGHIAVTLRWRIRIHGQRSVRPPRCVGDGSLDTALTIQPRPRRSPCQHARIQVKHYIAEIEVQIAWRPRGSCIPATGSCRHNILRLGSCAMPGCVPQVHLSLPSDICVIHRVSSLSSWRDAS